MAALDVSFVQPKPPSDAQPRAARFYRPSRRFIVVTTAIWWGAIMVATLRLMG